MNSSPAANARLTKGYGLALLCAMILSTTAVFIRYLTATYALPPLVLAFWRDLFAVLTLLPWLLISQRGRLRVGKRQLIHLAWYGLVMAAFNAFWTFSVAENGAAVATVLVYCSVAFTALLGRWLLREQLHLAKLVAIAATLSGCVLVAGVDRSAWQTGWVGLALGVLAGLSYAGYSLMGSAAARQGLNPWVTLLYTFGFAAAILLLLNLLGGGRLPGVAAHPAQLFWLGHSCVGWGVLLALAAGPTVFGFGLYNVSLVYLPSSVVNLVATSEPVFTAIIAYWLLGEQLSGRQALGSALILASVVALRLYEGRRASQASVA